MFKNKKKSPTNTMTRKEFKEQQQNNFNGQNNIQHELKDGRIVDENGEILSRLDVKNKNYKKSKFGFNRNYEKDLTGRLTSIGKQQRLKFRLNITIIILIILIIITFLILRFVN